MTNKCLIYGLVDPRTERIRYVGKSTSGLARPKAHGYPSKSCADKTYRGNWIRALKAEGLTYRIVVLEECDDAVMLPEAEIVWIARLRAEGCGLTNGTDGGEGCPGRPCSEETRRRLTANAARLNTPEATAKSAASRKGKVHRPEVVAKVAAANRGKKRSAEFSRRLGERSRGVKVTEETRARLSDAHLGKIHSAEVRARMSEAQRGRVITAEHRAALAASLKGHEVSAETRAKISASLLARKGSGRTAPAGSG